MKNIFRTFPMSVLAPVVFIFMISITSASAATFIVSNTNDSGSGSLRQAIIDANASSGSDIINFDSSFSSPKTITLTSGRLNITNGGGLTINGPGAHLLTVSGNNQSQVFELDDVTATLSLNVTFNNFTISNGAFPGANALQGSAIGMNNAASGPATPTSNLVLNNMSIVRNSVAGTGLQGTVACRRSGTITINDSYIGENRASPIFSGSNFGACSLTINNSTIEKNSGSDGLIVCCFGNVSPASINVTNSTINDNQVLNNGSAFRISVNGQFNMTNTTIVRNRSTQGNAAVIYQGGSTSSPTANLTNVTIANNYSGSPGGTATAGFWANGTGLINIKNSIIANNTYQSGKADFFANSLTTTLNISHSLVETVWIPGAGTQSHPVTTANGNLPGVDPWLDGALKNYGGSTKTVALRRGSPAIDSADPSDFPATDQRGISRPQDGDGNGTARSDMGAFELRPSDRPITDKADFDGDGRSDLSIYRPAPTGGEWWWKNSSNDQNLALQFGLTTDIISPGDFTGDGKTDIAVWRPTTNFWYFLRSEDFSFYGFPFGASGDKPAVGDYDGDGRADAALFRENGGVWFIINSSNGAFSSNQFGSMGDQPVPADYDGDGRDDLAIYRRSGSSGSEWWINRSSEGVISMIFGTANDKAAPADYTGDGKADLAFFIPSTGEWFIQRSENFSFYSFPFGSNGDIPVPGDYDGDGRADVGVYRPSNGNWFLNTSNEGIKVTNFGLTTDIPVPSAYVR